MVPTGGNAIGAAGTAVGQASPGVSMGRWIPTDQLKTAPPFVDLFPVRKPMVDMLNENMRLTGFNVENPIVVGKENGVVVDGHTRLLAARAAGLQKVLVVYRSFADETAAVEYAIKCQTNRRNLTDAELLRCVRELGKRRGPANQHTAVRNVADCGKDRRRKSSAAATAAKLDVSQRKAEMARTVNERASAEVKAAVASGDMTISAAYKATMAARRAADPEPQSAPMNAEVSIYTSDPLNVKAADAGQPNPTAPVSAPADTEVGPTAEQVLKVVIGILDSAAPTSTPAAMKVSISNELGAQFPTFVAGMGDLFSKPTARTPRGKVVV